MKFTSGERAALIRNGVTYATGSSTGNGQLTMHASRHVTAGRYTLELRHRTKGHWVRSRYQITIH